MIELPIKTESPNKQLRGSWMPRARKAKKQREDTRWMLMGYRKGERFVPAIVKLTRIGPRDLDDDNLRGALKHVRDGIADFLGIKDDDARVRWEYAQERCKPPKHHAVRIEFA